MQTPLLPRSRGSSPRHSPERRLLSASLTVFLIFVAPLWALTVLFIDMLVIYALLVHPEEFDQG